MEAVFLEHTYRWLRMEGVLILVIPFERLHDCTGILSSHFTSLNVFRMTDPDSVQYRQIAVFGVRHEVRGSAVENNKRQLHSIGLYGSFLELAELQPGACPPYSVPPSGEATLNYRGLPYDFLEDLLPQSGAWRQVVPLLMPHDDVATGRPITPSAWRPRWPSVHSRTAEWRLRRRREPAHRPLAVGQACDNLC